MVDHGSVIGSGRPDRTSRSRPLRVSPGTAPATSGVSDGGIQLSLDTVP
jgi:hypothetical protein